MIGPAEGTKCEPFCLTYPTLHLGRVGKSRKAPPTQPLRPGSKWPHPLKRTQCRPRRHPWEADGIQLSCLKVGKRRMMSIGVAGRVAEEYRHVAIGKPQGGAIEERKASAFAFSARRRSPFRHA